MKLPAVLRLPPLVRKAILLMLGLCVLIVVVYALLGMPRFGTLTSDTESVRGISLDFESLFGNKYVAATEKALDSTIRIKIWGTASEFTEFFSENGIDYPQKNASESSELITFEEAGLPWFQPALEESATVSSTHLKGGEMVFFLLARRRDGQNVGYIFVIK